MREKTLIYSFVSRGTVILAGYTEFKGNFMEIASQCLQRLPATNDKFTYSCDGHTFNFLVENGYTYCIVAVESAGRQIPLRFLERIKEDFTNKYAGGKAATAIAHSLDREIGPKLKEHMQYCMEHPDEISKPSKVQDQVSLVKGIMMENIERQFDRQENIDGLVDKTENLRSQARDFRHVGAQLRRKLWLQNLKIKLLFLAIIIVLMLIIILYLYADLYGLGMWAGMENPENSGNYNSSALPFDCAKNTPIACDPVEGSRLLSLGIVYSFAEDNERDVYLLASKGVYRIVRPSLCNYSCPQEKYIDNGAPPPGSPSSSSTCLSENLLIKLILLLVCLIFLLSCY